MLSRYIFLIFFVHSIHSAEIDTVPALNLHDSIWPMLYSQFHQLKWSRKNSKYASGPGKINSNIAFGFTLWKDHKDLRIKTQKFFTEEPLIAFAALDNHSNDIGLVMFFFKIASCYILVTTDLDFLFYEFLTRRKNLGLIERKITKAVEYVNSIKQLNC